MDEETILAFIVIIALACILIGGALICRAHIITGSHDNSDLPLSYDHTIIYSGGHHGIL